MYMSKLNHACRNCLLKKARLSLQKFTSIINCVFIVNKPFFPTKLFPRLKFFFFIDSPSFEESLSLPNKRFSYSSFFYRYSWKTPPFLTNTLPHGPHAFMISMFLEREPLKTPKLCLNNSLSLLINSSCFAENVTFSNNKLFLSPLFFSLQRRTYISNKHSSLSTSFE